MSFKKGFNYIVKSRINEKWYLVRQVSMKGWRAMQFTDADTVFNETMYEGNGIALYEKLGATISDGRMRRFHRADGSILMRRYMFDILMYGYFKD